MASNLFNLKYDYDLPPEDLQEIQAAVLTLKTKLVPRLLDLNTADRITLRKVAAKSIDFVRKAFGYLRANPQMAPPFVDVDGFGNDLEGYDFLREMSQDLEKISDMVDDTRLFLGARSYSSARAGYKGFQSAAEMGQPGAEVIVADLATQFAGQGRTAKTGTPPDTDSDPSKK